MRAMQLDDVIHQRRTSKTFDRLRPVDPSLVTRLLECARWAPNHRLTQPWRFRIVGEETRARMLELAGDGAAKLDTAPVLVVASCVPSALPLHAREDEHATACAIYAVLLAATDRGLASFWRTPAMLRNAAGRELLQLTEDELAMGLLYIGWPAPGTASRGSAERAPVSDYVTQLP